MRNLPFEPRNNGNHVHKSDEKKQNWLWIYMELPWDLGGKEIKSNLEHLMLFIAPKKNQMPLVFFSKYKININLNI